MRIALVSLHTSPSEIPGQGDAGGMNVVVSEAARALSRRGHEVHVVTRASAAIAPGVHALSRDHESPVTLVALNAGDRTLSKLGIVDVLGECARELTKLGRFDVFHSHYWLSGAAVSPVAHGASAPHVTTLHTVAAQKNAHLSPGDAPEPEVRVAGERQLTREAFVVAGSRSELDAIVSGYGAPPLGSEVVHPGVDTKLFHPGPREDAPLRMLVLGRVQPLKGQDLAIDALQYLAATDPGLASRAELIIAGEATPGAESFAEGLRARATGVNVTFLPAQSRTESAALLRSSHLVLIPSHSETFGLLALEAAASGTPVIAAHTTGLLESVQSGVNGVHVATRDPADWAREISRLLTDAAARAGLARTARAFAEQHTWDHHAEWLERIYLNLSGSVT